MTDALIFVAALAGMEAVAYVTHRFVMHGPLWSLHRSHHEPGAAGLEWNDLFGLFFAVPSVACIYVGVRDGSWLLPAGLGMTAYGALYFLFHDIVVHRRLPVRGVPRWRYLRRIIKAHLIHHKTHTREGARSFGFLYAPDFDRRPAARD